ncbi:MAG: TetR/AcrR family transcriptional regulator [Micrococcales bacterium]|nr:TetR/AcrR family transcriptional regulator [Micrococcales bacterium]
MSQPGLDQREAERMQVVVAAAQVIEQVGASRVTLALVAEASGLALGSILDHFSTLEEVIDEVIEEQNSLMYQTVEQAVGEARAGEALIRAAVALLGLLSNDVIARAGMRLSLEKGAANEELAWRYYLWIESFTDYVTEGIEAGQMRADLDASAVTVLVVAWFSGVTLLSGLVGPAVVSPRQIGPMLDIYIIGMANPEHVEPLRDLARQLLDEAD